METQLLKLKQPAHHKGIFDMLYTLFTNSLSKVACQLRTYGLVMSRKNLLELKFDSNSCY